VGVVREGEQAVHVRWNADCRTGAWLRVRVGAIGWKQNVHVARCYRLISND
jgi:hypothetical protein